MTERATGAEKAAGVESAVSKETISEFLARQIERAQALRAAHVADPARSAKRRLLREWQQARLAGTYRELLDSARYRPAAEFFLNELYGLHDTRSRDAAVERLYPTMVRLLPEVSLRGVGLALELDALSEELDAELLDALEGTDLSGGLTEPQYCEAYRRCDNYALRSRQIELIRRLGDSLAHLVEKPLVSGLLRGMRTPARLAGFGEFQGFLERGFKAFRHLGDPGEFLDTIEGREKKILDRIYACHPHPFDLEAVALQP